MAPELAQFEREYQDKISIVEVDVDERQSAAFQIYAPLMHSRGLPTTEILRDGQVVVLKLGFMKCKALETLVDAVKAGKPVRSDEVSLQP